MGTARTGETTSATDALTGVAKAAAGVGLASTADGVGVAVGIGVGNWVGACTTGSGSAQAVSNARAAMTTIPIRDLLEIIIRRICTSLLAGYVTPCELAPNITPRSVTRWLISWLACPDHIIAFLQTSLRPLRYGLKQLHRNRGKGADSALHTTYPRQYYDWQYLQEDSMNQ